MRGVSQAQRLLSFAFKVPTATAQSGQLQQQSLFTCYALEPPSPETRDDLPSPDCLFEILPALVLSWGFCCLEGKQQGENATIR